MAKMAKIAKKPVTFKNCPTCKTKAACRKAKKCLNKRKK